MFVDNAQQSFAFTPQTIFPALILIFTEGKGDEIESMLPFKIFSTLPFKKDIKQTDLPKTGGVLCLEGARGTILKDVQMRSGVNFFNLPKDNHQTVLW